jgi:hypothetical protein
VCSAAGGLVGPRRGHQRRRVLGVGLEAPRPNKPILGLHPPAGDRLAPCGRARCSCARRRPAPWPLAVKTVGGFQRHVRLLARLGSSAAGSSSRWDRTLPSSYRCGSPARPRTGARQIDSHDLPPVVLGLHKRQYKRGRPGAVARLRRHSSQRVAVHGRLPLHRT